MTLFAEIKRDILDESIKLSSILRKLKVLSVSLEDDSLAEWVNREIKGYTGVPLDDYPEYRVSAALNKGHFIGWGGRQMNNVEVHTLGLPEFARDFASKLWLEAGINEIERMREKTGDDWRQPWPPDFVATIASQFFENYRAMQVWKTVPDSALEYVLSTVRDNILDYILDMEKKNPILLLKESALENVELKDAKEATSILIDNKSKIQKGPDKPIAAKPMKIFISYSHKDEKFREDLESHIKILNRRGLISVWHDRRISAGQDWKNQIDNNLKESDIVLLLISSDFIASDYCYDIEVDQALENHRIGKSVVIPIIVRTSLLTDSKFMHLQALPTDAKAISTWADRDEAFTVVTRGIEGVILDRR
ncbi:AbiTii domain-containing protein [Deinococcus marmoris]|uniref:Chaperone protein DnaK n=1 Tax=Deinococcus marmoris TaxID=249408 RepID=A0A1U7P2J5_9DEIO|nr:TIR domain-containing protein [Deinococcus marmoris]OLV19379.1 Chaperone protein DnaK [Deinococcus marmoris]